MTMLDYVDPKKNSFYPRHVSERADALTDQLDQTQIQRLYRLLRAKELHIWLLWLEDARIEISDYDILTEKQRAAELRGKNSEHSLMLHHACIFLELWRARLMHFYHPLPPSGAPIDTPASQRHLMLCSLASFNAFDPRDLWPFERPEGSEESIWFPFPEEKKS